MQDDDHQELEPIVGMLEANEDAGAPREITELMGLLAMSLPPVEPPSRLRDRVLAGTRVASTASEPAAAAADRTVAAPLRFPSTAPRADFGVPVRWVVAAGLVVAMLFAGLSFVLLERLQEQERRVARLEAELDSRPSVPTLEAELAELRADLSVMTSTRVSVCALEGQDGGAARADGIVYLTPGGGRWILTAQGLEPSPSGRSYRIWFVAADGIVKGGDFHVAEGSGHIHFCADAMPADTQAIMITLEPETGGGREPVGPTVLYGRPRQLL
jgi:hypothetical protein